MWQLCCQVLLVCWLVLGITPASWGQDGRLALPSAASQLLAQLPASLQQQEKVRQDLVALAAAYGQFIRKVVVNRPDQFSLLMVNGHLILYDDQKSKTPEERLAQPDLEDMLAQPYVPGKPIQLPQPQADPGRCRVAAFFEAVYGATPGEVQANLVAVPFCGTTVRFQGKNGAAAALAKVGERLSWLLANKPSLRAYVLPLQGTYNYRRIAGTDRLSAHAWGIAIDLHRGTYWRWGKILAPLELRGLQQSYPLEIIQAFEAEGFIWGGKWYHYDTMHFEYRPELLAKARLLGLATP